MLPERENGVESSQEPQKLPCSGWWKGGESGRPGGECSKSRFVVMKIIASAAAAGRQPVCFRRGRRGQAEEAAHGFVSSEDKDSPAIN